MQRLTHQNKEIQPGWTKSDFPFCSSDRAYLNAVRDKLLTQVFLTKKATISSGLSSLLLLLLGSNQGSSD